MVDQIKNLMIGMFVTAATVIVIFILMFLHPSTGDQGRLIHVRFTDIDKVTVGTRVTYAGKPVGEVIKIDEVSQGRSGKTDEAGQLYTYDLTLLIDSGVHIYNTDQISVRTSGLLGEKNVEITPYAPKPGQELILMDKDTFYAMRSATVEETFKEFKEVADKIETLMDGATEVIDNIHKNKLVDKITDTVDHIKSISKALDMPERWSNIVRNIDTVASRAVKSWDGVDKALSSIDQAALEAKKWMAQGNDIFDRTARGEGTLGKLLVNDETYLRTSSIMSKAETILDDINHYGILFHNDKGWQRLRARRLNLLQRLQTPQEFRNYFNDEVDQISTSIARVAMVLSEVESNPCCHDVMQDAQFTKVFAELMRRVQMLEEEVRLYNTQAMECQVHETELGDVSCYPFGYVQGWYCPESCVGEPWEWMPQYQ